MADMRKCLECGKEYEAKRSTSKYCSGKCRKLAFQSNDRVSVPIVKEVSVLDKPKCKYCGTELDHLKLVCCGPCAWGRQGYAHTGQWPKFQSEGLVLTGDYKLTAFEREHYRPASELGVGQHNPVSRPGDSHYG